MRWAVAVVAVGVALPAVIAEAADGLDAVAGKALFNRIWIPAPSSTNASDGLGPLFNARSCAACHVMAGPSRVVRGHAGQTKLTGAVVRFGTVTGMPDPFYGLQLQTDAVPGLKPEGTARFLPSLTYHLDGPPLAPGVAAGARLAPSLAGRAAFDQISDDEILKRADPDDRNHDGISGRANRLAAGIGRFGWKAGRVTLTDQVAHAFAIDIGLSSPREPRPYGDCTLVQTECRQAPTGESPQFDNREVSTVMLDLVAQYLETVRAQASPANSAGAALFDKTGCASCHVPDLQATNGGRVKAFSDFLLHNMGPELDDRVGEPGVAPSEWRTAPLIDKNTYPRDFARRYTHNGSAATVKEAIEKHGGEGAGSRKTFKELTPTDKQRLIDYVDQQ